jgi:hypothetical protein
MTDQTHLLKLQGLNHANDVSSQLFLVVSGRWRIRPAHATKIRTDHPVPLRQCRDYMAPGVPMLRLTMKEQHGIA